MDTLRQSLEQKLGAENLKRVEAVKVGIAGGGGLGSNCAACLVRSGFRRLRIVDLDRVTVSNLDRQFFFSDQVGQDKVLALKENLQRIAPGLSIEAVKERIEAGSALRLFGDCDIVAECLDRAEYKSMLVAELSMLGKFTVSVSGLGGFGSSDDIKVHRVKKTLVLVGDLNSDVASAPALSPRVNIAAAKQADEILHSAVTLTYKQ